MTSATADFATLNICVGLSPLRVIQLRFESLPVIQRLSLLSHPLKVYEQEMKEKMRQWEAENQEKFEALEKTRQEELKKAQEAAQAVIDDGGFVDDEED
jgi:hypothetical protein